MVYFRDHRWLVCHGATRFSAHVGIEPSQRDHVMWCLDVRCIVGGAKWRRVRDWQRPQLDLSLSSFEMPGRKWSSLEQANFWGSGTEDEGKGALLKWLDWKGGFLDVWYSPLPHPAPPERTSLGNFCWRVAQRERGRLTVELACLANGTNPFEKEVRVLSDGTEEAAERDEAFWKANSQLYLLEEVPFGTVTVRVPRNVKDTEAYAINRARALFGTPEPEHLKVMDYHQWEKSEPGNWNDPMVELHYHGYYED